MKSPANITLPEQNGLIISGSTPSAVLEGTNGGRGALRRTSDAIISQVHRAEALLWLSLVGLIVPLALASLLAPLAGEAQQTSKVRRIGLLTPGAPPPSGASSPFEQALRELGWVEGHNLAIEPRYAAGRLDQLPDLAAELVRLPVELIVVVSFPAALAAKHATTTIPIVIARGGDPVGTKLVASLARPGGNITGVSIPEKHLAPSGRTLLISDVPDASPTASSHPQVCQR